MVETDSKEYANIVLRSTKRYHNCLHKIIQLTPCALYLLLYLAEKTDDECVVDVTERMRDNYIAFIKQMTNGEIEYKDVTVKKSLQELKKLLFLVPTEHRGHLYVNPKYFYNGRNAKRLNMIKFVYRKMDEQKEIKEYLNGKVS